MAALKVLVLNSVEILVHVDFLQLVENICGMHILQLFQ